MDIAERGFISLLAASIGTPVDIKEEIDYLKILELASAHGVANMLYYALPKLPEAVQPDPAMRRRLKELAYTSAARETIRQTELDGLLSALHADGIRVLPLKGCVVRRLYPQPEMRHMSDIDLLIDPMQAESVKSCMDRLGYHADIYARGTTDFYLSPMRLNCEIHKDLSGEGFNGPARAFVGSLLTRAKSGDGCRLELSPEEHYAYLICHFVKHLMNGGIGVRQVMDVYLCRRGWQFDETKLAALLRELELTEFTGTLERLGEMWFGCGEPETASEELGEYILKSGAFGREEQKVADRMLRNGEKSGRLSYAIHRLFPPYSTMANEFPALKKVPAFLTFYWIFRFFRSLFSRRGKLLREIDTLQSTDETAVKERAAFYRRCGLNVFSK